MMKKLFTLLVLAMMLSLPFMTANAYAISFVPYPDGSIVKVTGEQTDAPGYIVSGDTLHLEVTVDDDSAVSADQIRLSNSLEFTNCVSSGLTTYTCTFSYPNYPVSGAETAGVYLFEKSGTYSVPTSCSDTVCTAAKKCKECTTALIKTDVSNPSGTFTLAQQGAVVLSFTASDPETGISKVAVYVDNGAEPIATQEYEVNETIGSYPLQVTDNIPLQNIAEGMHDFKVYFYNGVGKDRIKTLVNQYIDRSPPSILGWYINAKYQTGCPTNAPLSDVVAHDITATGTSGKQVCVYVTFENNQELPSSGTITLRNLDTQYPNVGFESQFRHCGTQYCMFDAYTDGNPIELYLQQSGTTTVSADVTVADASGNEQTTTLSKSIQRIDTSPTITSFRSSGFNNGVNYVGSETATIILTFDAVTTIDTDFIRLDASALKAGASSVEPDYCTSSQCVWEISGVTAQDSGTIFLKGVGNAGPEDQFGNQFIPVELRTMNFVVDDVAPELQDIEIENLDAGSWTNDCTDRGEIEYINPVGGTEVMDDDGTGFCNNCTYTDPRDFSSATAGNYCDVAHFFKPFSAASYFTEGGYFDVTITIADDTGFDAAYLNASHIVSSGAYREGVCSDAGDGTYSCTWTSVGPLLAVQSPNDHFDITLQDLAGNMRKYKIPLENYRISSSNIDFWDVSAGVSSPDKLDTQLMSAYGLSQLHVLDYSCSNCGGANIIGVEVRDCDFTTSGMGGLIESTTAFWHGNTVYLRMQYGAEPVDGIDTADIECEVKTTSGINGVAYGPETDTVTIPVTFFNAPFGTVDESIEELIQEAAAPWNSSFGIAPLVAPLEDFFQTFKNICGITQKLTTTYNSFVAIVDMLKLLKIVDGGTASIGMGATTSLFKKFGLDWFAKLETTVCKAMTCEYCKSAITTPDEMLFGDGNYDETKLEAVKRNLDSAEFDFTTGDMPQDMSDMQTCFSAIYSPDEDGYGNEEGFDPADLCIPAGIGVCVMQYSSLARIVNNPLQASELEAFSAWLPPEGQPVPNDPYNSLVLSTLSVCLPGITHNLNKLRQIDCKYIKCLRDDVSAGTKTVTDCDIERNYASCQFVVGEGWTLFPLSGFFDQVGNLIKNFIFNPLALMQYATGQVCPLVCLTGTGSCTACHVTINFINGVSQIADLAVSLTEMTDDEGNVDYSALGIQQVVDECDGVIENELSLDLFSEGGANE